MPHRSRQFGQKLIVIFTSLEVSQYHDPWFPLFLVSIYKKEFANLIDFCMIESQFKYLLLFSPKRNWVFATNSKFIIPISLEPNVVNLWYFKLTLFDLTEFIVWNVKGLRYKVAKKLELEYQSLWQRLKYFVCYLLFPPLPDPTVFLSLSSISGKIPGEAGKDYPTFSLSSLRDI